MYIRGYRYPLQPPQRLVGEDEQAPTSYIIHMRRPYQRAIKLVSRDRPPQILELHWYRDEAAYREKVGVPTAQVEGVTLEEPFPGVLVPPGVRVEDLEFDDDPLRTTFGHLPPAAENRYSDSARRLAAALADRLRPILPGGFSLAFGRGTLIVLRDAEALDQVDVRLDVDDDPESIERAVWAALDRVQDTIVEETTDPWPNTRPILPGAVAEVRDGLLHLGYADREGPVVELEPIPIAELRG
jgi:hypothetical protein